MEKVKAVRDPKLSGARGSRYVIVDAETGRILDTAQGYGYKSAQKAYAAYAYKTRSPAKKARDEAAEKAVKAFVRKNRDFIEDLDAAAFKIAKGSMGPDEKFNAKFVAEMLEQAGYRDLPFTAAELIKYA